MFRKPRNHPTSSQSTPSKPATGRPPTPPYGTKLTPTQSSNKTKEDRSATTPLAPRPISKSNVSMLGRQGTRKAANSRTTGNSNGNILKFFQKIESPLKDDSLFISQDGRVFENDPRNASIVDAPVPDSSDLVGSSFVEDDINDDTDSDRFNELEKPNKRRRICEKALDVLEMSSTTHFASINGCTPPPPDKSKTSKRRVRQIGGFIDDSDSDEEDPPYRSTVAYERESRDAALEAEKVELGDSASSFKDTAIVNTSAVQQEDVRENRTLNPLVDNVTESMDIATHRLPEPLLEASEDVLPTIPSLKQEATSFDDYGGFDDIENFQHFDDEEFGEEFEERKWMEEQAKLEAAENSINIVGRKTLQESNTESAVAACPICEASLVGVNAEQASRHINACLDCNPIKQEPTSPKMLPPGSGSRFSRSSIAKPGQANPFTFGDIQTAPSSAFSKLMASHAEDAAWATAAAAEQASRGKPAYQRTCPFYKIMPGFFICVDAFRYGKVEGCNAYFLSHFHSDHYIGLTSNWSHGPIYCSKVTANLVKQQLRVDPKWVIALEFETRIEVPNTQGVTVTMIPANHCPGSSLFLFEKIVGKGQNPKIQRVLHCGDFRACPAHISHPLLMPDIVCAITGKTKQQKIDVCYLDTTYLNPRYAFPSQEDVIKACADMCVSLKKERAEESDAWEIVKKERAGTGMTNFVGSAMKFDDSIAMEVGSTKRRGRLLVVCGTYSIGKERICMGIARALDCKIWAPPGKQKVCAALEDPELMSRLTDDPKEAQIHMQMLMEIRAETLQDYLNGYKPHFSRIVGFRPSGWNYRPPNSRFVESPAVQTVLMSDNWKSRYTMHELSPQRGSTREASCFGVPYSEHSSFRELTMFCCALRIEKVIPTVNVGSATSRAKMKMWIDRWLAERRKSGAVKIGKDEGMVRW